MKNILLLFTGSLLVAFMFYSGFPEVYGNTDATRSTPHPPPFGEPVSHATWDRLLQAHVHQNGMVNYKGFIRDSLELNQYLTLLSENPPARGQSQAYCISYWANVYNAFTIRLIIRNYPLKSIRDLDPKLKIPGIRTVWHKEFFQIGGEPMSLDHVEHGILRKKFNEPRIHFVINCASYSCPVMPNRALTPQNIEEMLSAQAYRFINDSTRNKIGKDEVQLSRIFQWFYGDFTRNGSLIDFLNQYAETAINPKAKINYLEYDWSLNELKGSK